MKNKIMKIENYKRFIFDKARDDNSKKWLETLNSLDYIKEQENQLKIAQNKVS